MCLHEHYTGRKLELASQLPRMLMLTELLTFTFSLSPQFVGLSTATVVLPRLVPRSICCDCNCVILRTNKARCALSKKILDLPNNEKHFWSVQFVELVYKFNKKSIARVFKKVS